MLCTGGEACGTKLMTRLISQMGTGAIHRSVPWDGIWPDFLAIEFDVAIVMVRDWWAAAPSQLAADYVDTYADAQANLRHAYREITAQLAGKPWQMVSYESLVADPRGTIKRIAAWLGLKPRLAEQVFDANKKWLKSP